MAITLRSLLSLAGRIASAVNSTPATRGTAAPPRARDRRRHRSNVPASPTARRAADRRGQATLSYSPSSDGKPDPGEIVWTWVPYEDDPAQGKDRPVLLIGREGSELLGLMLTSRDRNNARDHDARYVDIGTGGWDRQGRPSEVKVDRLLRIDPGQVRREGAVLPRQRFEQVVAAVPDALLG
ncbi:type II toxin-antitoxin system PemK/MazF family toxin [Arthrobacter sp. B1805]|uniref:type II toxin-antitoxin system PemK/MazF family toxin n=1 Tax=Arthrobacter sp. B1805 TaxID=2058892 RepID=UPI000CE3120C|nr:type II toxin-antitoxin system PemK/MazF family toxin [Arthrobacter sp. B1805]